MHLGKHDLVDDKHGRTDRREINVNHHINHLYFEWCLLRIKPEEIDPETGVVVVEESVEVVERTFIPNGVSLRISYRVLPTDTWRPFGSGSYSLRDYYYAHALNLGSGQVRIECVGLPQNHRLAIEMYGVAEGIEWLSSQE